MMFGVVEKAIEDAISAVSDGQMDDPLPFHAETGRKTSRAARRRAMRRARWPSAIARMIRHKNKKTRRTPRTAAAAKLRQRWAGRHGGG